MELVRKLLMDQCATAKMQWMKPGGFIRLWLLSLTLIFRRGGKKKKRTGCRKFSPEIQNGSRYYFWGRKNTLTSTWRILKARDTKPNKKTRRVNRNTDPFRHLVPKTLCVESFKVCPVFLHTEGGRVFPHRARPCRPRSCRALPAPVLPGPAWLAPTNCHMFQLVWLWTMIYFHYFWQSSSHSSGQ